MLAKTWEKVHFVSWTVLVLCLGYVLGALALRIEKTEAPPPLTVRSYDVNPRAPFVELTEINSGKIVGMVGTGARLVISGEPVVPRPDRTFAVDASMFLVNMVDIVIPHGVQFVASSRGKNYYSVHSTAGQRLVPQNRVYFRTEEEAEQLGYKRGR